MRGRSKTHRGNDRHRSAHGVYDKSNAMTNSCGPGASNIVGHSCDRQHTRAVSAENACLAEPRLPVIAFCHYNGKLHTDRPDKVSHDRSPRYLDAPGRKLLDNLLVARRECVKTDRHADRQTQHGVEPVKARHSDHPDMATPEMLTLVNTVCKHRAHAADGNRRHLIGKTNLLFGHSRRSYIDRPRTMRRAGRNH